MEGLEQYEESERGVILRHTMLEERGTIRLRSYFRALVGSGERLFAVTEGLVEAYDLSDAHMPTLAGAWQAEGVLGAVVFGEKLLFWGEPGIWVAEDGPPALRNEPFTRCEAIPVRGAVVARDQLFVLRGEELLVYNLQLCEEARYDAGGAEEIAAAGRFVTLLDREGLRVFDGHRGPAETRVRGCCSGGITKVETPALPFDGPTIYARGPEGGMLLRLRDTGAPETIAEFPGGAWFAGVVRAGRILAYSSDQGRMIRLLEPGRTEQSE